MRSSNSTPVGCECGWRGKRVYRSCECYEMCYCSRYGYCPKCKGRVESVATMKVYKRMYREIEEFERSGGLARAIASLFPNDRVVATGS